jgi:formate hydrogenlyase subunit 6/NADH:ubiquinone oxidoreductase subunit I
MAIREKVAKIVPGGGTSTPPPDLDPRKVSIDRNKLLRERKRTFGIGLLKGMAVTLRHLFKHNTVIQYPDEKQDLAPRTRGVIALKEENCTVCMLCGRECPDWCIYIDSHKETLPPKREGGRPRKRNVLDRFAIDYALCMYCGICVEVCPYDALFWSREFEYAELDIRELTHEKERLSDWMASVLPPPALEDGADLPGAPAAVAAGAGPGAAQRPSPPAAATAAGARPEQAARPPAAAATAAPAPEAATPSQEQAGEAKAPAAGTRVEPTEERAPQPAAEHKAAAEEVGKGPGDVQAEAVKSPTEAKSPSQREKPAEAKAAAAREEAQVGESTAAATPAQTIEYRETPGTNVAVPHEEPRPVALEKTEDPEKVYEQVLKEQLDAGSSPQVAEARAKVARVKAERGIRRGPTPIQTDKMVPSAPTKAAPPEPKPSGAPGAEEPQPPQGPVAPTPAEEEKADEKKRPDG